MGKPQYIVLAQTQHVVRAFRRTSGEVSVWRTLCGREVAGEPDDQPSPVPDCGSCVNIERPWLVERPVGHPVGERPDVEAGT